MAAGNTYEAIATNTLSSATSSVTFSSIPSTYTDLVLVSNFGTTATGEVTGLRLNSDTATNYSMNSIYANSSNVIVYRRINDIAMNYSAWNGTTATLGGSVGIYHIMNYANTTAFKTALGRSGDDSPISEVTVGLWRSTAAVTSVTFFVTTTTLKAGSTVTLYGIKAA